MNPSEEPKGTAVPPPGKRLPPECADRYAGGVAARSCGIAEPVVQAADPLDSYEDGYPHEPEPSAPVPPPVPTQAVATLPRRPGGGGKTPPPPPPPAAATAATMTMTACSACPSSSTWKNSALASSKSLMGVAVAFALSLTYSNALWDFVSQPAVAALKTLGYKEQNLVQIEPMEAFNVIWFKLPVLCAIFLAAPWILYQVWAFISPGLYRRERRWAAPFVLGSGGLFILGGVFAYFVVFRFGLTFLLSIGQGNHVVADGVDHRVLQLIRQRDSGCGPGLRVTRYLSFSCTLAENRHSRLSCAGTAGTRFLRSSSSPPSSRRHRMSST